MAPPTAPTTETASPTVQATASVKTAPCPSSSAAETISAPAAGAKQAVPHAAKAWEFFRSIGSPKYHVAPMVDQSELPFRMLCRHNGATCAYTPMFHARLFAEDKKYRSEVWSTCPEDRPLMVQFCANDPAFLVRAAKMLEHECDAIDINFGCPQRIARRGYYGSFLMDNLPLVEQLVSELSQAVSIPVTCKIRIFPELEQTLAYARMVERAGCSVLAVHGRTREQKDNFAVRADWDAIRAVKQALSIPVLANGNVRNLQDADECLRYTGCDGILSAESLLADPALFLPSRALPGQEFNSVHGIELLGDYLRLVLKYPVPMRMVKGHVHKLAGPWLAEHTDLRDKVNTGGLDIQGLLDEVIDVMLGRIRECGRLVPIPKVSERAQKRMEREAAMKAAIEEQEREAQALANLSVAQGPAAAGCGAAAAPAAERVMEDAKGCCDVPATAANGNGDILGAAAGSAIAAGASVAEAEVLAVGDASTVRPGKRKAESPVLANDKCEDCF